MTLLAVALAVDKLGIAVQAKHGTPLPVDRLEERIAAVLVASAGILVVVASFVHFILQRRVIDGEVMRSRALANLGLLTVVACAGALLVVYLVRIGA